MQALVYGHIFWEPPLSPLNVDNLKGCKKRRWGLVSRVPWVCGEKGLWGMPCSRPSAGSLATVGKRRVFILSGHPAEGGLVIVFILFYFILFYFILFYFLAMLRQAWPREEPRASSNCV